MILDIKSKLVAQVVDLEARLQTLEKQVIMNATSLSGFDMIVVLK